LWFEGIYRFRRGDFNFKFADVNRDESTFVTIHQTGPNFEAGFEIPFIGKTIDNNWKRFMIAQGASVVEPPVSNGLEVALPYYGTSLCEVVGLCDTTDNRREQGLNVNSTIAYFRGSGTTIKGVFMVAAGDNYRLGFLVGPPARSD
jgi:hypothetical protein